MKSFEFKGQADPRLQYFGLFSLAGCLLLCFSTAAISDGGDLNHPLYFYGSRFYWLLALIMIYLSGNIYRDLWSYKQFVPEWSYSFKKFAGFIALGLIVVYVLQELSVIDMGFYPEWIISLFIIFFILTLYWDLKNMDILLRRK